MNESASILLLFFFFFAALKRSLSQRSAGGAASRVPGPRLVPRAGQLPRGNLCRLRPGDTYCLLQVWKREGNLERRTDI